MVIIHDEHLSEKRKIQNKLNKLRRKLIVIPYKDIYDDGRDGSYSYATYIIDIVGNEFANIEIPGVSSEELDNVCRKLCLGSLPEEKYNHHIKYIEHLEEYIKDKDN